MDLTERLVSIAEAAQHLHVSPKTVRRRIADGELAAYRVGRLVRLDAEQVRNLARPIPTSGNAA